MEEVHKSILTRKRSVINDSIGNPEEVLNYLYEKGIFTENMRQVIEAEPTTIQKTINILDLLPTRGPLAFETFKQGLKATGNDHVVELLDDTGDDDAVLPTDWPNEEAVTAAIIVRSSKPEKVKKYSKKSNEVYPMTKNPRGRCVIISNKLFTGPVEKDEKGVNRVALRTREGTEKDAQDLQELFKQLYFTVVIHKDQPANEIRNILKDEASNPDQNEAECFVFVICSHGTTDGVYGADGEIISQEEIQSPFDGDNCRALRGKPKIFFIQACQGEFVDRQMDQDIDEMGLNLCSLDISVNTTEEEQTEPQTRRYQIPKMADFLVACATHPGYVSIRHKTHGAWFVQAIVYVFQKFAYKEDINGLFVKVNNLVTRGNHPNGAMQVARFENSIRKRLFFFPGHAVGQV